MNGSERQAIREAISLARRAQVTDPEKWSCAGCGTLDQDGYTRGCRTCVNRLYKKRTRQGVCPACGGPKTQGHTRCLQCWNASRRIDLDERRRRDAERKRALRERRGKGIKMPHGTTARDRPQDPAGNP